MGETYLDQLHMVWTKLSELSIKDEDILSVYFCNGVTTPTVHVTEDVFRAIVKDTKVEETMLPTQIHKAGCGHGLKWVCVVPKPVGLDMVDYAAQCCGIREG